MIDKKSNIFNLEAEQSVLGSIILEGNLNGLEGANFKSEDYSNEQHRLIFLAMLEISKKNKPIDLITLTEELKKNNVLEQVGGISYLTSLTTIVPTTSNIKYYAEIVKDLATKRKLLNKITEIMNDIGNIDNLAIVSQLEDAKNIVENTTKYESMFTNFGDIKIQKNTKSLSTGFLKLDRALHGLEYGTLTVLTGEPATGKSTILNQIIANAISNNEKVFLYSGELPQNKIKFWFNRTVANASDLAMFVDEYGKEKYYCKSYASNLINKWANDKLFIFNDQEKPSESNLIGSITYLAKYKGVRLIVLDNLMTMITDNPTDNEYQKQKYLVNNLKNLAKKYELVIILVAHANKKSKENKDPNMFDVAGASEIVNLSDYVLKSVRDIVIDKNTGEEEEHNSIHILKNRIEGVQGVYLKTYFDDMRKRFYTDEGNELEKDYGYNLREQQQFQAVDMDIPF